MRQKYFKSSRDWREWLAENHERETGIWLTFHKKAASKPSIDYKSAVEEALCFGWIDSIIKKIDDSKYVRKFTPRRDNSRWSEVNKKRVENLISSNRMTDIGLAKIKMAKKNGLWDEPDISDISTMLPEDFKQELIKNKSAKDNFEQLAPSYKRQFIGWINAAKRPETREKRIKESIILLARGQKLGMK